MKLRNKTALITGGSRGLGRAIAEEFLRQGARVFLVALEEPELKQTAGELGCGFEAVDVSCPEALEATLARAVEQLGRLDILVNNAAVISPSKPVEETSWAELQTICNVNLGGAFWAMRCAHPHLRQTQGCVLNISSMAGVTGQADHAAYAMSKGGINALTRSAAVDLGADRIRVNALCPAGVWTPALRVWASEQSNPEEASGYLNRLHALGYCPETNEIAPVAAFLCSDEARFVTGHIMNVSGGSECGYRI